MKDWNKILKPLLELYRSKRHPLEYQNLYQLLVMVVLSAQDSDANINKISPALFEAFPDMESLSKAKIDSLIPFISKVRNFQTKASWLVEIAQIIKEDKNIPQTMEDLVALKGIGRKSANVILRESGGKSEGIIVDLHVIRVAPRLGLAAESKDGNKIEKQIMAELTQDMWEVGMPISFLGREICRPTNPKCDQCILNADCNYYQTSI
ncbi:endonuclease III [Lacihabitans sp. CCS-44]|uniref:endonuclease III domain-containing protein n=1 Tax=Lacihabitans sp. CCS-44 TaxID=2487331 RepID=UPI0020CBE312|nr:endonuclease III [Lacihabitans sp. CCS-44]MCP9755378.1 endonuclease III [Lacihabitans sp. CCS-44]